MKVNRICLNNFRNFKSISLDFKDNINILQGKNAKGKTNILEAIFIALTSVSFRNAKANEWIKFNEPFLRCVVFVQEKNFENKISYSYEFDKKKVFKIDDIKLKSLNELYDFSNVLVFFSDEIKIITESSLFRRNFIDSFIVKMVKGYKQNLILYRNVIFRRNLLLKGMNISSYYKEEMNALTKKAAVLCFEISRQRKIMIDLINEQLKDIHKELTKESLYIEYESIVSSFSKSKEEILKEILDNFFKTYKLDTENKITNFGIHKENFKFILNDKDAKLFSSQGQKRNIIISVKMAQKNIFEKEKFVKPIVLLDDLFNELDEKRIDSILDYLNDNQIFITMTDMFNIDRKNVNIINI